MKLLWLAMAVALCGAAGCEAVELVDEDGNPWATADVCAWTGLVEVEFGRREIVTAEGRRLEIVLGVGDPALVEDIVFTIALTAIQAEQVAKQASS